VRNRRNQSGELLNKDGRNSIEVWDGSGGDGDRGDYTWFEVTLPQGMSSEEFDKRVISSFNRLGRVMQGEEYSPHGAINSNWFVFMVITLAGGKVPGAVQTHPRRTLASVVEVLRGLMRAHAAHRAKNDLSSGIAVASMIGISHCLVAAWIHARFGTRALWTYTGVAIVLLAGITTWRMTANPYAEVPWQTNLVSIIIPGALATAAVNLFAREGKRRSIFPRAVIALIVLIVSFLGVAEAAYSLWGSRL
jgi:hypothetical protein